MRVRVYSLYDFGCPEFLWFCVDSVCPLLCCGKYCVSRNFPALEDRATKTKFVIRGILDHRGRVSQSCSSFRLISIRKWIQPKAQLSTRSLLCWERICPGLGRDSYIHGIKNLGTVFRKIVIFHIKVNLEVRWEKNHIKNNKLIKYHQCNRLNSKISILWIYERISPFNNALFSPP